MNASTATNLLTAANGQDAHAAAASGIVRPTPRASLSKSYKLKQRAAHRCINCGNPLNLYPHFCDTCREKQTARMRRHRGNDAWRPGGPGRPPKWACLAKVTRQRDDGRATLKRISRDCGAVGNPPTGNPLPPLESSREPILRAEPKPASTSLEAMRIASPAATTQLASTQPTQPAPPRGGQEQERQQAA